MGLEGDVLDLSTLESTLEQVNRLRSNTTKMDLLPGDKEGRSIVELKTEETLPFFGFFGLNNYGSSSTGKYQLSAAFTWENFFGFSDILSLNINTTDKRKAGQNSLGNGVSYSVPLGKWLWEGSINRFRYTQTVPGLNENYVSHGVSDEISLATHYKLYHTRTGNIELQAKVTHKNVQSYINNAHIASSSYDISVGSIGSKYVYRQPSWEFYFILDYHRGLNLYTPTRTGLLPYDFSKWTLASGATKYFQTPSPMSYQFSGYMQYSDDLLYSAEQINIGGAYSVRGFQKRSISGSTGGYVRNDLSINASQWFSPYIAYDYGYIKEAQDTEGGSLSSAIIGWRSHYKAINLDVYHAIPLTSPNAENFGSDPFIGISLSATL